MPKRSAEPIEEPLPKKPLAAVIPVANVWDTVQGEDSLKNQTIDAGPKTRVQFSLTLGYKPKIQLFIALNGEDPEVRVESPEGVFLMSGEEFITATSTANLSTVRLEVTEDGYRLARYIADNNGDLELDPFSVLDLNRNHMTKLKEKLREIQDHVTSLIKSKDIIRVMFRCIAEVYRQEQRLMGSLHPLELARRVECYVPSYAIVRTFTEKMAPLTCRFNHYNLCTVAMSQRAHILNLCNEL